MKWFLNAFPKSGLHLLDALCKPLTVNRRAWWAGTHANSSWTFQRVGLERVTNAICYLPDNWRLIGHTCYDADIEWYLALSSIAHIFIHRDLRDVAVSQAHHILSDDDNLQHPDKELYRALGSFDNVLDAVWNGYGEYPGIEERWAEYEPWLDKPDVLIIRFEDAIADLEGTADKILDYGLTITPELTLPDPQVKLELSQVLTNATEMAASARDTDKSPTFRRGVAGEWRNYHIFERQLVQ